MCIPTFSSPPDCLHDKHLHFSPSALPEPPPCCSQLSHPHLPHVFPKGERVEGWVRTSHERLRAHFLAGEPEGPEDITQPPARAARGPLLSSTYLINLTEIKLQVTTWEWEDGWLMCPQTEICSSLSNLQTFKKASERGNHRLTSAPRLLSFVLLPSQGTFTSGALTSCPALLLPHTHVGDKLHPPDEEVLLRKSLGRAAQCHRPHQWGHRENITQWWAEPLQKMVL